MVILEISAVMDTKGTQIPLCSAINVPKEGNELIIATSLSSSARVVLEEWELGRRLVAEGFKLALIDQVPVEETKRGPGLRGKRRVVTGYERIERRFVPLARPDNTNEVLVALTNLYN